MKLLTLIIALFSLCFIQTQFIEQPNPYGSLSCDLSYFQLYYSFDNASLFTLNDQVYLKSKGGRGPEGRLYNFGEGDRLGPGGSCGDGLSLNSQTNASIVLDGIYDQFIPEIYFTIEFW